MHMDEDKQSGTKFKYGPTDPKFEVLPTWAPCLHTLFNNSLMMFPLIPAPPPKLV